MKKILLIEDNYDIRDNAAEFLELSNYIVIQAENGEIGISKAIEHMPDLILCDVMMPVLDGYGVVQALKKNETLAAIPIIFLTAKSEGSDIRLAMEMGINEYITKPFNCAELLEIIQKKLNNS